MGLSLVNGSSSGPGYDDTQQPLFVFCTDERKISICGKRDLFIKAGIIELMQCKIPFIDEDRFLVHDAYAEHIVIGVYQKIFPAHTRYRHFNAIRVWLFFDVHRGASCARLALHL